MDRAPIQALIGVILTLILSLGFGYVLLRPPMADLVQLAAQLTVTAVLSVLLGFGAWRTGWIDRSPRLAYSILAGHVLATALIVFNVWISARLMFINRHDLLLGTALLVYAGGIAVALGYLFAVAITGRLTNLNRFAEDLAGGDLDARTQVAGRDEIADLGRTLNEMASQLESAREHRLDLERMRRELIAWAGHDLRTPLASVRAIVEALADGVVEDEATTQRYLATAQQDIRSLSVLIDDLFALAQIDAGGLDLELAPNSMHDLVSETLERFRPMADRRDIRLSGSVDPAVRTVMMDPRLIGRVLNNLVSNALRHTPSAGEISIRVTDQGRSDTVLVRIRDTGEGIPGHLLPRVFERFQRGERSRSRATGGSGLGLAIAKGIVEAHDGQMSVRSTVGEGTEFAFTLPDRSAPR